MTDWTDGYVADIGYTFGHYRELNPLRLQLAFINAGLVAPTVGSACELGFGQGVSVNLHAAGSLAQWFGTDFNPEHAGRAQELARASGAAARLFDQSFADFCVRPDLPDFDYIALHGIWSWISDKNRDVIVDFVRRKLKVGGVLYTSYNTLPGWAAIVPLRDLMVEHGEVMGAPGLGTVSRIDAALEFTDRLFATKPGFLRLNPVIEERLKMIKGQARAYVAHEYFNSDWAPMAFSRMARWLAPAKLAFACSANYMDAVDILNLDAAQQALLKEIPDPMFRELVRDFMVNQYFRKDYWVRGARKLSPLEQEEALRAHRVVLIEPRADVSLKVKGALGEATMQQSIYGPVLDVLADHQPRTLGQIGQALDDREVSLAHILQVAMILTAKGTLAAAQDDALVAKARRQTDRLNAYFLDKARGSPDNSYLASPLIGGGVLVPRFHQLFLLARGHGRKQPAEWAQWVWQLLDAQGQKIIKEDKPLEGADASIAELLAQARIFAEKHLPILKALGIA